jgi:DNA-directed RNA polymerase III subunit RPC3
LIQQHLALHYTDDDGQTFYEVNWASAYGLVRSGKIIKHAEDRLGEKAGSLLLNLFLQGHARVQDLADAYGLAPSDSSKTKGRSSGANEDQTASGKKGNQPRSMNDLQTLLQKLLHEGYIMRVNPTQFKPEADLQNDAERHVRVTEFPLGVKGSKEQKDFLDKVNKLKRKWKEGDGIAENSTAAGESTPKPAKRAKVNGYRANGVNGHKGVNSEPSGPPLVGEVALRVNHEKFGVVMRNQRLVELARESIGETTSKVYEAFLRVLESQMPVCHDEFARYESREAEFEAMPSATNSEILAVLDKNIDLDIGIQGAHDEDPEEDGSQDEQGADEDEDEADAVGRGKTKKVNGHAPPSAGQQRPRLLLIQRHMRLLSQSPKGFVKSLGLQRGGGQFKADFRTLSETLVQHELETLVMARFGPLAARAIRILQAKGRLEEKQVSTLAMSRPKDIRSALSALQASGMADIQEVPKDSSRQPSRTMFLWFFDQERCRQLILNDTYKAMSRLIQQIKVQKAQFQLNIDKAERIELTGSEDKLTSYDKDALRDWRNNEEKLLTQLGRQDDLVAVLRDFIGPGLH